MATEAVPVTKMPADMDARKVVGHLLALGEGASTTYEEVAACVGPDLVPGTVRFKTVLDRARLLLRRLHNVECETVRGVGLRRIPERERVVHVAKEAGRGVKAIARASNRADAIQVEKLSEGEQRSVMHVRRVLSIFSEQAQRARKEIGATLTPPQTLPRG